MQIIIVHIVVKSGDPYKPGYGNKQNVFFKEQNPLKHKKKIVLSKFQVFILYRSFSK